MIDTKTVGWMRNGRSVALAHYVEAWFTTTTAVHRKALCGRSWPQRDLELAPNAGRCKRCERAAVNEERSQGNG